MYKTKNNLQFEACDSPYNFFIGVPKHKLFRVGTCEGQWGDTYDSYFILSVVNSKPGNGHLNDVFEWFEMSCKRDNKNLLVLECENERFYNHLISKRGFVALDKEQRNCIKVFNKRMFKRLKKKGNPILKKGTLKCV